MGPFSTQEGITTWEKSSQFSPCLHLTFWSSRVCLEWISVTVASIHMRDRKIISPLLTLKLVNSYVKICWEISSNLTTHSLPSHQDCLFNALGLLNDTLNSLLDPVGEGEGGMFQENSVETCILSRVKQITSPGWMHETSAQTWCTGTT